MSRRIRTATLCRCTLFLVAVFLFCNRSGHLSASARATCQDYCDTSVTCDHTCFDEYDNETTCGDWGVCAPDCSDVCGSSADCDTPCSNSGWCGGYNGGLDSNECYGACGDGTCQNPYENCATCPSDCGSCTDFCSVASCYTDADCPTNDPVCNGGCCMAACSGSTCDGRSRSCDNDYVVCLRNSDCCPDEKCVSINRGDPLCYEWPY